MNKVVPKLTASANNNNFNNYIFKNNLVSNNQINNNNISQIMFETNNECLEQQKQLKEKHESELESQQQQQPENYQKKVKFDLATVAFQV